MHRRRIILVGAATLAARRATAAAPPPAGSALTRIAFGSCADHTQPQAIWTAVNAYRPELFLFMGDNVYGDVSSGDLLELRAAYAAAARIPGIARLRRETPVLAIWDDHDYGANDAGAEFAWKRPAKQLMLDFWDVPPTDPRRGRDGAHHAVTFGPAGRRVQVILLDTRWFRSPLKPTDRRGAAGRERYLPDDDPAKTMLGAGQWAWLEARLRESAELRLIVSSIQVLADGHGWERWGNLPRERQRLFDLIAATRAAGVVVLSGDRHLGAFYRETAGTPYALIEATSSGINRSYRSREPNFGTIDVDWDQRSVALALRGVDGGARATHRLALDALAGR